MREGEYYRAAGNGREEEGRSQRARSRACGLPGVAFCPPAASLSARQKNARVRVSLGRSYNHEERDPRAFTHEDTRKRKQLLDLVRRGESNPTISSPDSRMRADVPPQPPRRTQGMLQYTRACRDVALVRAHPTPPIPPPRTRPHPPDSCYCCDLMKCYARSPAITFPLHRLTPHPSLSLSLSLSLSWRDSGTPFLPDCDPWG